MCLFIAFHIETRMLRQNHSPLCAVMAVSFDLSIPRKREKKRKLQKMRAARTRRPNRNHDNNWMGSTHSPHDSLCELWFVTRISFFFSVSFYRFGFTRSSFHANNFNHSTFNSVQIICCLSCRNSRSLTQKIKMKEKKIGRGMSLNWGEARTSPDNMSICFPFDGKTIPIQLNEYG